MSTLATQRTFNLVAGLLIPAAATMLFNVLVTEVKSGRNADIPHDAFDFALGCAFSMIGVAVAQSNRAKTNKVFVYFLVTLLLLILTDIVLKYRYSEYDVAMILLSDGIALIGATLAILE